MKNEMYGLEKASPWQRIFLQGKVNGAPYSEEQLMSFNWSWPKDTYFQHRLQYLRRYRPSSETLTQRSRQVKLVFVLIDNIAQSFQVPVLSDPYFSSKRHDLLCL
jgi:hypothetical protein